MPGRRLMIRALVIGGLALPSPSVAVAATASTTTSTPSAVTVTLGGSVSDSATVTGDPLVGVPAGTVSFSVCGPLAAASGCQTGGTAVGAAVSLTPGAIDTATATSDGFIPTSPGTWCFRADYSGDANYGGSSDGSVTECFSVTAASSSTSSAPGSGSIALGGSDSDTATVTGNAAGGSPTGTVSFYACGPLKNANGCPSGGQAVGAAVALAPGAGDTASATSAGFTPSSPGIWCFGAVYSGSGSYASSSDTSSDECFTVTASSSSTSSAPVNGSIVLGGSDGDSATVTGNLAGGSPTGTLSFFVCGPLTGAAGCPTGGQAVGAPVSVVAASADTSRASSPSFTPTAAGTWCFRAEYSGDSNYATSSDASGGECFTVGKPAATVSSTPASATTTLAGGETDTATVTGNGVGGSPGGTVSFHVCGPLTSPLGCPSGGQAVGSGVGLTPASATTATATSASFTPTAAGIWCFRADYSGDGNYAAASDAAAGNCFTVPQPGAPTATITSPVGGAVYGMGHPVTAAYSCRDAPGAPGLSSCVGSVPNGGPLDTSTRGQHSFQVTAVSRDGLKTTVTAGYSVAGPPSVTVSSPANGAVYTRGMSVPVSFTCSEDEFGPGLASCSAPPSISTWQTGAFALTATAKSADGLLSTQAVHYSVVLPSNRFTVSRVRSRRGDRVTFTIVVPVQGNLAISETALRRLLKPSAAGRVRLARLNLFVTRGGTLNLVVVPTKRWRKLLARRGAPMKAQLKIVFTPTNGVASRKVLSIRIG